MWILNRKIRYEIMKKLINESSPERIMELVRSYGFDHDCTKMDVEYRRSQLIDYLDEMNECWNEHNIDLTDRQFIKVMKKE